MTVIWPDSVFTVLWTVMGCGVTHDEEAADAAAADAAAACIISSFFILAARIFANKCGVGWLEEIVTVGGLDTNDVSRDTILFVLIFGGSDALGVALDVGIVTACVLII